jgi:hypothetical protein
MRGRRNPTRVMVAPEASDLLRQSDLCVLHQLKVTAIPEFVPVTDGPRHTAAGRLNRVFRHQLCAERREFSVPIDDLVVIGVMDVHAASGRLVFISSASRTLDPLRSHDSAPVCALGHRQHTAGRDETASERDKAPFLVAGSDDRRLSYEEAAAVGRDVVVPARKATGLQPSNSIRGLPAPAVRGRRRRKSRAGAR